MNVQLTARSGRERRRDATRRERELAQLAEQQHSVLTRAQLVAAGLGPRTIRRRVESARLRLVHRGVYAFGSGQLSRRGRWMAAVLACGEGAMLSHRSGAALWGFVRPQRGPVEISSPTGRGRQGITVHEGGVRPAERSAVAGIPVTSVARTLFDLAEILDEDELERAFEEADRLRLLDTQSIERVCAWGHGRHALRPVRRLIEEAREPTWTRSELEDRFQRLCRKHDLPPAQTNVSVLGYEADAYWPDGKLVVEVDGWSFHHHRAAFEHDRARDAAMQAAGYRVIRVTHRRLTREPEIVAAEIRHLLTGTQPANPAKEDTPGGRAAT